MNIDNKLEEVGGVEVTPSFIDKRDNHFDVKNYLTSNILRLPDNFIDFSIKYGFGQFNKDVVFESVEKIPVSYSDGTLPFTIFYGWGVGTESLQETRESLDDQISSNFFVFAEGNPGDYLLIDMNDFKIYYFCHNRLLNDSIFLVANNFEDFILSLKFNKNFSPEDDIEEEWFADDF